MKEFVGLLPKMYSYLTDDEKVEKKRGKQNKKMCLKHEIQFDDYNNCLKVLHIEIKINFLDKEDYNIEQLIQKTMKENRIIMSSHQRFKTQHFTSCQQ